MKVINACQGCIKDAVAFLAGYYMTKVVEKIRAESDSEKTERSKMKSQSEKINGNDYAHTTAG